jgi:hypothetical protein
VNDSAIQLIGEVFLIWCLGAILVVWVLVMWRRRWGWDDLYFLMVWICVVGWVLDGAVVVRLWVVVVICVRDNSLVVGWLCSRHPVPGGLCFRAIPSWVCTVLSMKQAVISTRLLRPSWPRPRVPLPLPWGDIPGGEGPRQQGAGWLCCAPAADCSCPVRSLTVKALSRFGWTTEGPWAFSETRRFAVGALRIWCTSRTADRALGDFWVGP